MSQVNTSAADATLLDAIRPLLGFAASHTGDGCQQGEGQWADVAYADLKACVERARRAIAQAEGREPVVVDREQAKLTILEGGDPHKLVVIVDPKPGYVANAGNYAGELRVTIKEA